MNYLFIDCETGGLTPEYSLLSAAFILTDATGKEVYRKVLHCRPLHNDFVVHPKALEVNKIDLVQHSKTALHYAEATHELHSFADKYSLYWNNTVVVGHNIQFDLGFLNKYLNFTELFNRGFQDTQMIAKFLELDFSNLKSLAEQLKVDLTKVQWHTAAGDAEVTKEVYFAMKSMIMKD